MVENNIYNRLYAMVGEYGLLYDSYWKEQMQREIENAIREAKGYNKPTSLDIWVRKILREQRRMKCGKR